MVAEAFKAPVSPESMGAVPGYGRLRIGDRFFLFDDADDSAIDLCGDFRDAGESECSVCRWGMFHHQSVYQCSILDCAGSFWSMVD